jgi:hypothetical protein
MTDRLQHFRSADDLYRSLVSEWRDPAALLELATDCSLIQEPSSPLDGTLPSFTITSWPQALGACRWP